MGGSRGGDWGTPPPLKNHKNIGFLGKTGPDPLKNFKATKPAFNTGHHRPASEMPFKWRFAGGPIINQLSHHQLKKRYQIVDPL